MLSYALKYCFVFHFLKRILIQVTIVFSKCNQLLVVLSFVHCQKVNENLPVTFYLSCSLKRVWKDTWCSIPQSGGNVHSDYSWFLVPARVCLSNAMSINSCTYLVIYLFIAFSIYLSVTLCILMTGVVQNNSQCQISVIHDITRAPSRKVSYAGVYLFLAQFWKIGLGLVLIIPTSGANLVLRVIWQCDRFGTTPASLCKSDNPLLLWWHSFALTISCVNSIL